MALQKTMTTPQGFEAENAYHRVEDVKINMPRPLDGVRLITFVIRNYKNQEMPFFNESFLSCNYDIAGENPIKQAYEYLKTLPDYADATDV